MSGLYNMIFSGGQERGAVLLPTLGFSAYNDVGRFRDAWVERDGMDRLFIRIYTRNGGGNREAYAEVIDKLRAHPLFERDMDDIFDTTYASFWFRIPEQHRELFDEIAVDPVDMDARWLESIDALQKGPVDYA
jgi:hypothetical protein